MCDDWMGGLTLADSEGVDRRGLTRPIAEPCPSGG
jgi:hypothetical protein